MTDSEKLDLLLKTAAHLTNQMTRINQNQILEKGRADANEVKDAEFRRETRERLDRIERAVVLVAKDAKELRERLGEVDDRHDRRLRLLEGANGHG